MPSDPYLNLFQGLRSILPLTQITADELSTLSLGTDASFYRLTPRIIVTVNSEEEVKAVLAETRRASAPVTFRAAGTSLSGQAITDSVLVVLGPGWSSYSINNDASLVRLQPGIVGAHANIFLAPFGKKIGPDPASINSAKMGGIAANNASGMCCGTAQNSYRTLSSMRIIFADGTLLDTGDRQSREEFAHIHAGMLARIAHLARDVKANGPLADRIRHKYRMKNTTGYSLNALVDFDDPFEIIQHLLIGSEGTLGFIADLTLRTVPELPCKASSLMLFPDIETACRAVPLLKQSPVDAVELMDRASLRSVEGKSGMPTYLQDLGPAAASLLVETRSATPQHLAEQITSITNTLEGIPTLRPISFTADPADYTRLWNIRKGLFPSVGAIRETGTTVIIEDVAFPVPLLAQATLDLQQLLRKYRYHEAIIFGHALEGNLHFVFTQDFGSQQEIQRYRDFIGEVSLMVVRKYDGALKAEHGTGRNMAPFVELEWGSEAYGIMKEIKTIFDPDNLLNPGVILNPDPEAHVKNLKPLPPAHDIIDKCIECGFCEVQCPSRNLTLTPRQRIIAYREMARMRRTGGETLRLQRFEKAFRYMGDATCATDGLCATSCPVGIDTGKFVKDLRYMQHSRTAHVLASAIAGHMNLVTAVMAAALDVVHLLHTILGTRFMKGASTLFHQLSGRTIPLWNPWMPKGADRIPRNTPASSGMPTVVYFPTCINRSMGVAIQDTDRRSLTTAIHDLLRRAGYNVVYPNNFSNLCCGMAFASKGFKEQGDKKAKELEEALLVASCEGEYPVLVDMSPCLYRMKEVFGHGLHLYEPVQFILEHVVHRLEIQRLPTTVAVHNTCSAEKMGLATELRKLAGLCAEQVVVPHGVGCCGWAGDRGFTVPELNASALAELRRQIPEHCSEGYSTSRTCEIGLSVHSGKPYRSIVYLVDQASKKSGTIERD